MLRSPINLIVSLLCAFFISCGFVDLRPVEISIQPEKTDSLLPDAHSPVILKFNTEMEKAEAEGIMQISSDLGTVRGDRFWKGNDLYFVPVAGWTAGIRYTLSLLGTARSVDGREIRLERFVSFYAINKNAPPFLEWYSPADGESTGTGNVVLQFHFTCPMNRLSVEAAITIEGIANKTFEWAGDDSVKVIPDSTLNPWTTYRWNLRDTAKSADEVPIAKAYSGRFITDIDQTLPGVTDVYPVLYADGSWYPTGASIEKGLGSGQGIAVEFNKPMGENVLRSVRLEPSLTGRTEFLSEKSVVWIFSRDPEPETIYTLTISSDARDSEGLKTGSDYKVYFTPDIPFLNVISFMPVGGQVMENFSAENNLLKVKIDSGTGEIFFSIQFSLMFSAEEKQNSLPRITLSPFFPRTLAPVALQYADWISNDRLYMRWEGLSAGSDDGPHYYRLTIPGGRGGIKSSMGIYMKEDLTIYLEAVR
jgi:hypothetical protein